MSRCLRNFQTNYPVAKSQQSARWLLRRLRPRSHRKGDPNKPTNGIVTSVASVTESALDELRAGLAGNGRGLISVKVELQDDSARFITTPSKKSHRNARLTATALWLPKPRLLRQIDHVSP